MYILTCLSLHTTLGSLRLSCKIFANLRSTLRIYFYRVIIPATTDTRSKLEKTDLSTIFEHARCIHVSIPQLGSRPECLAEFIETHLPKDFLPAIKTIFGKFWFETRLWNTPITEYLDSLQAQGMLDLVGTLVTEGLDLLVSYIFPLTLRFTKMEKLIFTRQYYPALLRSADSMKIVNSSAEHNKYNTTAWPSEVTDRSDALDLICKYFHDLAPVRLHDSSLHLTRMVSDIQLSTSLGTTSSARTAVPKLFLLKIEPRILGLTVGWFDQVGLLSMTSADKPILPIGPSNRFTELRELSITQSTLSAAVLAQFLHQCPTLESFFCAGCEVEDSNSNWRLVFDALRDHPRRMMVKIDTVKSKRTRKSMRIDVQHHTAKAVEPLEYYEVADEHKLRRHSLVTYLMGEGDWNHVLEDWFDD